MTMKNIGSQLNSPEYRKQLALTKAQQHIISPQITFGKCMPGHVKSINYKSMTLCDCFETSTLHCIPIKDLSSFTISLLADLKSDVHKNAHIGGIHYFPLQYRLTSWGWQDNWQHHGLKCVEAFFKAPWRIISEEIITKAGGPSPPQFTAALLNKATLSGSESPCCLYTISIWQPR